MLRVQAKDAPCGRSRLRSTAPVSGPHRTLLALASGVILVGTLQGSKGEAMPGSRRLALIIRLSAVGVVFGVSSRIQALQRPRSSICFSTQLHLNYLRVLRGLLFSVEFIPFSFSGPSTPSNGLVRFSFPIIALSLGYASATVAKLARTGGW